VTAEEADAENTAGHDMRGGDRQSERRREHHKRDATRLAVIASRVSIGVIFLLIVCATRNGRKAPPTAIARATNK